MKANSIDLRKRIQIFGIMEKNLPINYIKGLEGLGLVKVLFNELSQKVSNKWRYYTLNSRCKPSL